MTLLDARLLSEYACQRTAGTAARGVLRELAQRGAAATIEQRPGIQGKDLIDKSAEMSAFDQNIRPHDVK